MTTTSPAAADVATDEKKGLIHRLATKKAMVKLVPLMMFAYLMSYIDRSNVGLAKEALAADVGISAAAFGLGAGIFFIGYALLEIPSNLALHKVGPRVWLGRIAISWGLISSAMMFVNSETMFYVLRVLLGIAEAGLYPGLMYVITMWFAQKDRAKAVSLVMIAGALGSVIGNPIGGALMLMDGLGGLHGWQWMFLIEGIPAVIVGILFILKFPNRPHDAKWLTTEEADALVEAAGTPQDEAHVPMRKAFSSKLILAIAGIYFLVQLGVYGPAYFIPSIIGAMGVTNDFAIGLLAGAVSSGALIGLVVWPRLVRFFRTEVPLIAAAWVGIIAGSLGLVALDGNAVAQLLVLTGIVACVIGQQPLIWSIAMSRVSGKVAAASLALVNTIGLLGGFFGPLAFGIAQEITGSAAAGFVLLAPIGLVALAMLVLVRRLMRSTPALEAMVTVEERELVNA